MSKVMTFGVACVMAACMVTISAAQTTHPSPGTQPSIQSGAQTQQKRVGLAYFLKQLGLTRDQKQQIKQINQQAKADIAQLKASQGDPKTKRQELKAIQKSRRQAVLNVLTPAQRQQLKTLIAQWKANGGKAPNL